MKKIDKLKSREKTSSFFNSPLTVTIVGFLLTGLVGGFLTYWWHTKEYEYKAKLEQEYSRIRAHRQAWEGLYDKIFDKTSEFGIAVARVISIYEYSIGNVEQQREIIKNFNSVSREWFKQSIVIRSQLKLLFFQKQSQEVINRIEKEWTELIDESELLHKCVADLVTKYNPRDKSPELTKKFNECKRLSDNFTERVYSFGNNLISTIFPE